MVYYSTRKQARKAERQRKEAIQRKRKALEKVAPALLTHLKKAELVYNAAILATPTGDFRNKLTEMNIERLQTITEAEAKNV